ncbi:MAG: response regulator transcription factor [Ignavibacteriae bacterium]|nr:response regulator transcription factor [Ignavibacteriota bacterium]
MTVMIVDDSKPIRDMLKSMLAEDVEQFYECEDGTEAVEKFTSHHPDWVLMDIKMKKMDGITATRKIKQSFPQARIIVMTQHSGSNFREQAIEAGAHEFVGKERLLDIQDIISS